MTAPWNIDPMVPPPVTAPLPLPEGPAPGAPTPGAPTPDDREMRHIRAEALRRATAITPGSGGKILAVADMFAKFIATGETPENHG